ncbi:Mu-like prophage major head subunit gpT family protein [Phycicoccus avicenniae]|uniref:phage major capsid protein n=1 Tax=Phycicoccus avicenniae TaxID=2828860 RepID=UPI003D2D4C40
MSSALFRPETFGLNESMRLDGDTPRARRDRERASEAMRSRILQAKSLLEAAWHGDPLARLKVNEAITTSDLFKSAAGAVLDRILVADYERRQGATWSTFSAKTSLKDFKPKTLMELTSNTGALPRVPEHANYSKANIDAAERTISVGKFGEQYGYTFEARVNDDIGELEQVPAGWSAQATATENRTSLEQMANPLTGAPNTGFFSPANTNIYTGALTADNLQAAYTAMTTKRDKDGSLLVAPAMQLIVGPALQFTAERIMNAQTVRLTNGSTQTEEPNPLRGKFQVNVLPNLPGTAWFLVPVPQQGRKNAFYTGFLIGYETPDIRVKADAGVRVGGGAIAAQEGSFDDDTVWFRVRHIVGGAQGDPTFTMASDGTGTTLTKAGW